MAGGIVAVVAVAAGAGVLAWLHYAFWTWRLREPARDDGVVRARTSDGWELALGVRGPRGAERLPPVLLVHGLSANRWMLDAGVEALSLGAYLSRHGFRTFALDLRGHGDSREGPGGAAPWCFDDYVRKDVPAALDAIREATGEYRVLYVGHSLGAVTGLVSCELYPERIAAAVAIAGPMSFEKDGPLARFLGFGILVDGRANRILSRMVAPFVGFLHPFVADLAINGRNVDRAVYRRILANSIENVPGRVFAQLSDWVKGDACRSADRALDYRAGLAGCRTPALFLSAVRDYLSPPSVVRRAFDLWGGPKELVEFSTANGHSADYGHVDLLLGKKAPLEVYPVILRFLLAQSASSSRPEESRARSGEVT